MMTYQVKEGDVLEYRGDGEPKSFHNFTIGKRYVVKRDGLGVYIVSDTGKHAIAAAVLFETYGFHLVATTPPETIQHEGYNYTRGEHVVPEWVKDGAWVVDMVHDRVLQMRSHGLDGYSLYDQKGNIAALDPDVGSRDLFRPFTNEDWKWGMWAEHKGEKAFVSGQWDGCVEASKPTNPYFYAPFSEITPTTAP